MQHKTLAAMHVYTLYCTIISFCLNRGKSLVSSRLCVYMLWSAFCACDQINLCYFHMKTHNQNAA